MRSTGVIAVAVFIAFFLVYLVEKPLIPFLRRLKVGNTEREELKSHQSKNGTPSMGGLGILIGIAGAVLVMFAALRMPAEQGQSALFSLLLIVLYGAIGFADDFIKTVRHRSDGLIAWQKMGMLIVVTVLFLLFLMFARDGGLRGLITDVKIPFTGYMLHLGWVGYPVFFLAVLGTINGVNFTDGVDGLASSVTIPVAAFFVIAGELAEETGTVLIGFAVIGALMGFLMHNAHPAKIFMGDTGSLALGGFVAVSAYMTGTIAFVLIVGLIYWIEILSVMLQVGYFKATKGKRIFRMAPIHHHFELGGMSETQVVTAFAVVTWLLFLAAVLGL